MDLNPYYPKDIVIDYVPNTIDAFYINIICIIFFSFLFIYIWRTFENRSVLKRALIFWFILCGFIHSVLEGYFVLNHKTLASDNSILAQIWKEYAKSDSRYLISDAFTLSMETVTAFLEGPLCFCIAYFHIKDNYLYYPLQLIVSFGQLYGDILYISTNWIENFKYTDLTDPFYFWVYFIFMNLIWIIIPFIIICDTVQFIMLSLNKCHKLKSN